MASFDFIFETLLSSILRDRLIIYRLFLFDVLSKVDKSNSDISEGSHPLYIFNSIIPNLFWLF